MQHQERKGWSRDRADNGIITLPIIFSEKEFFTVNFNWRVSWQ
ncbi:hypothetical protein EV2_001080 [Malus domestica]